jgi:hypothetical protein
VASWANGRIVRPLLYLGRPRRLPLRAGSLKVATTQGL